MKQDERWESRLEELREFKREHGHCDVPKKHPGGLGLWVMTQRRYCFDARRIRKLEDEGFRWVVNEVPNEERWNARLEELREFKREYGHCDVPHKHPGGLGSWVRNQRMAHKQGKRSLDARRIRLLEDEGFRWVVKVNEVPFEERWDARLKELREFKREHGHCDVPMKHPGGLGLWVMIQRRDRKEGRKCMDARRIQKLEDEGFKWEVQNAVLNEKRWDTRLEELREFRREYGHCDVPQRLPGGLGRWVVNQRRDRKEGRKCMDARRIQKLEDEGFRWVGQNKLINEKRFKWRVSDGNTEDDGHTNHPRPLIHQLPQQLQNFQQQPPPPPPGYITMQAHVPHVCWPGNSMMVNRMAVPVSERVPGTIIPIAKQVHPSHPNQYSHYHQQQQRQHGSRHPRQHPPPHNQHCRQQQHHSKMERAMAGSGAAGAGRPASKKGGDPRSRPLEEPKAPGKEAGERQGFATARQRKLERRPSEIASEHEAQAADGTIRMYQEDRESAGNPHEGRLVMRDAVEGLKSTLDKYEGRLEPLQEKLLQEELRSAHEEIAESTLVIL